MLFDWCYVGKTEVLSGLRERRCKLINPLFNVGQNVRMRGSLQRLEMLSGCLRRQNSPATFVSRGRAVSVVIQSFVCSCS